MRLQHKYVIVRPDRLGPGRITRRTVETKPIHANWKITIPFTWSGNNDVKKLSIKWKPAETVINSATLRARVFSDQSTCYFRYFLNDQEMLSLSWPLFGGSQWLEASADVTSFIFNGDNLFKADYVKGIFFPGEANAYVYGDLILDYTGTPPVVPPPYTPPDYMTLLTWLGLGVIVVGGGYVVVKMWKEAKPFVEYKYLRNRRREE